MRKEYGTKGRKTDSSLDTGNFRPPMLTWVIVGHSFQSFSTIVPTTRRYTL